MSEVASLNTKIDVHEKEEFQRNTQALGMTPSAAIKVFVRMFNECRGFPFEVRARPKINYADHISDVVSVKNGVVVVPSTWGDDDDDDDE